MADNVTLYIADPSMLGSRLFDQLPEIQEYEGLSDGDSATGFWLALQQGTVTVNFMPSDKIPGHLQGLSGWVQQMLEDPDQLTHVLSRIRYVRLPLGCIIEPGFDEDNQIQQFIFNLNDRLNGIMFLSNTIFDFDGEPIAGHFYDLEQEKKG